MEGEFERIRGVVRIGVGRLGGRLLGGKVV